MFCSKCGKEISNDATFCSGCGSVVNGSQSGISVSVAMPKMSAAEKDRKIRAVAVYCMAALMGLAVLWIMISTQFDCLTAILGDSYAAKQLIKESWEDYGGFIVLISVLMTLSYVIFGVVGYVVPLNKRNFAANKKTVVGNLVTSCIMDVVCGGMLCYIVGSAELDVFFIVLVTIVLAVADVFAAIAYVRAADAEVYAKFKETHLDKRIGSEGRKPYSGKGVISRLSAINNGYTNEMKDAPRVWICNSCGTENSNTDAFCKDCGKYK